ncbi:MAG: acyl-CoA dehydrogenase family protein [Actinomycetota bacterium]
MDFAFSPEQDELRAQARRFMTDRFPAEKVVEVTEWIDTVDEPELEFLDKVAWSHIAELGWIGLSASEDAGGSGMSFVDEAVLLEELGYALYPGPYLSTVGLALPALERQPDALERVVLGHASATASWRLFDGSPPTLRAVRSDDDWKITGSEALIPDLWENTFVVVAADAPGGVALFLLDMDEVYEGKTRRMGTMDATRRLSDIRPEEDGTAATLLSEPGEPTESLLHGMRLRALTAAALEAVGVAQRALDLAKVHVTERRQFDRPIGSYQAVSHQVADTYMEVELARSLSYWAAWCVAESDPQAEVAAAAAKASAAPAAIAACERAIQVHGGIGFTWEHILHRYYKRAQWLESFGGTARKHRAAIAEVVLR